MVQKLEEKERVLQGNLATVEKELTLRSQALEFNKRKVRDSLVSSNLREQGEMGSEQSGSDACLKIHRASLLWFVRTPLFSSGRHCCVPTP